MNIPDGLPTLDKGPHNKSSGQACVMELVSVLAGEQWTDYPVCVNEILAESAQRVNDFGSDDARRQLLEMVEMFIGTAPQDFVSGLNLRAELRSMWKAFDGDAINTCYDEEPEPSRAREAYQELLSTEGIQVLKRMIARCDEFNGYDRTKQEPLPVQKTLELIRERIS